ncbi:hypothetical protein J7T55_007818 [Diaporthe amygdali]|uniref:uncharacterized protein n=1 Tax=Phomopsis amygdali TaxID=1214568 RepID=UPI0022FE6A6B|nr:uncharacterized protein J7T55_007818 [Diaporthe amygdali]KAJ0107627.1 hypothetical protein J7T55_007818 [Diaporthe amygdali]
MDHDQQIKANKGPKACATCAKAKSRCIPGPTDDVCERCHRLNKPCSAQTPAPPRKRKAPKPTRVAELEKRLEDLSARVELRQGLPPTPSDGGSPAGPAESNGPPAKKRKTWMSDAPPPAFGYIFAGEDSQSQPEAQEDSPNQHRSPQSPVLPRKTLGVATPVLWDDRDKTSRSSSSYRTQQHWSGGFSHVLDAAVSPSTQSIAKAGPEWPKGEEAERLLAEYREYMEPVFPFIVIPRHMNSEQLRKERPYLWKAAIMQTLCLDASRQLPLGNELLNDIVTSSFLQPKKSFDLLQGLEILVAWFHVKLQSFQITNLLYLMRSMCVSLGFSESQEAMKNQEHDSTSLEQKRAFTGVYYLVTMIFTTNKKPDAFMNTSYLESCCRVIEEKMEYPTDELIAYLIRTQQLSQSISMTLAFRNTSLPLSMIIKSFREQIGQLRASIPDTVKKHTAIKTQLHIAEILLYEVGIHEELSAALTMTERLELLWECLKATRSMLEARFEVPMVDRPRQTCLASFDYTYAMLTSLKLSTLALPGWDLGLVRRELDAAKFLDMQIHEVKWLLEKRSRGAWRADGKGARASLRATLDPLETLYKRLMELRVPLRAELAAAVEREVDISEAEGVLAAPATAAVPGVSPSGVSLGEEQLAADPTMLDFTQDPEGPFWQDMYRVNEWETNFSSLFGWGLDDQGGPAYAVSRLDNPGNLVSQVPTALR